MKTLLLILLISSPVFAQGNNNSLYAKGLKACLEKELEEYSVLTVRNLRDVFIAYDLHLTRNLPTQLGEIKAQYLDEYELAERVMALPKERRERGIPVIKIFPLSDRDDKLYFAYNRYWFTYSEKGGFFSRKKLMFGWGLEGGCHAEIGLDASQEKFHIKGVKLWGI